MINGLKSFFYGVDVARGQKIVVVATAKEANRFVEAGGVVFFNGSRERVLQDIYTTEEVHTVFGYFDEFKSFWKGHYENTLHNSRLSQLLKGPRVIVPFAVVWAGIWVGLRYMLPAMLHLFLVVLCGS
jgi:hypothetical protein